MKRIVLLAIWIAAVLFPFGYLTVFSQRYASAFNFVFASDASHVLMHAFIFAGLMAVLVLTFARERNAPSRAWLIKLLMLYAVVAFVAGSREWVQLLHKARQSASDEWLDIATDLTGATVGLVVVLSIGQVITRSHRRMT